MKTENSLELKVNGSELPLRFRSTMEVIGPNCARELSTGNLYTFDGEKFSPIPKMEKTGYASYAWRIE